MKILLGVVLATAAAACGSVSAEHDAGDDTSGDFTLTVAPNTLTIPIAGSAKTTVTVERTGTVGDITLSATAGANLTVAFNPPALGAGVTTSEVTVSVVGGTTAGTSNVTVTGTAGAKTHDAMLSVTTTTITVSGTVRGARPGITVGIVGKPSVTSGAGGVFTFTDVTPPYDLYTFINAGCGTSNLTPTVYYFDDLTQPDPIVSAAPYAATCPGGITVICGIFSPCPNSNLSGTKAGAGNQTDEMMLAWSEGSASNAVLNGSGSYTSNASWHTSSNTSTGQLHALQLTRKTNGAPNTFLGYQRSVSTTLTSGTAATINITLATVNSTGTITGTLTPPAGYAAPNVLLNQQFGNTSRTLWSAQTSAIDAVFPVIPLAGGDTFYASSVLMDGGGGTLGTSYYSHPLSATATVNFTMPAAATQGAPADAATGVTSGTAFAFTAPSDVITEVVFYSTTTQGTVKANYNVFTRNAQVTMPAVSELPVPSGQSFAWYVRGYGPNTDINASVMANELELTSSIDYVGSPHAVTYSTTRTFITQ